MKHDPWKTVTVIQAKGDIDGVPAVVGETGMEGFSIHLEGQIGRMQ